MKKGQEVWLNETTFVERDKNDGLFYLREQQCFDDRCNCASHKRFAAKVISAEEAKKLIAEA